ncbi:MAG: HAMP domain-containing histidine kinase [Chitinophagaceae bacterium]|nr:HAMP domain-containing histidine kinase [Chitinophagaceae bacterium]
MKKIPHLFVLLMGLTLLVITGFQLYWLNNNYDREKRSLEIKTNLLFQDAVRNLQIQKLKLTGINKADTAGKRTIKMIVQNNRKFEEQVHVNALPKEEVITMVNTLRKKFKDSAYGIGTVNSDVIISMNTHSGPPLPGMDTTKTFFDEKTEPNGNRIFRFLYGVDSLQDTLKIPEINLAYAQLLKEEKLSLPFTVLRLKKAGYGDDPEMAEVTVGFANPITYRLQLGNSSTYLLKKISMPILFSLFLVGVTMFSFVLLYRTVIKQQRLAAIKNDFISNITHELKTPIATVGVAIEALKNFNALHNREKTKEYLDISSNELQRLSLLVDKVLKLSMLEKKEIEITYEPTDLNTVVDEVVNSLRLQLEKCDATINLKSEGITTLQADRLHLLSVVYNLVDNAIKYSSAKPQIRIVVKELEEHILLTISDNGIGIAPEYRDRIFEKFFRVPMGNTHNAHGYGLGLSYVAHIIEQHHGSIKVESELNKGTTFIIQLPKADGR